MLRKKMVVLVGFVCAFLLLAGSGFAQIDKLTRVAEGTLQVGQSLSYPGEAEHGGNGTYHWVELETDPPGQEAMVKLYSGGKEIDAFPVSNKEMRMLKLSGDLRVEFVKGTATGLRVLIMISPYPVGPGH